MDMGLPPGIAEKILEFNEVDTMLDIGPSIYVVTALKRGIKLGLIEKLETPGEKRLYMGHRYRAVRANKKSPKKKSPKKIYHLLTYFADIGYMWIVPWITYQHLINFLKFKFFNNLNF